MSYDTIKIGDKEYEVDEIGGGSWTTAYKYGDSEVILKVHNSDYTKAIALGYPKHPHLPRVEFLGEQGYFSYYKMPLYKQPDYYTDSKAYKRLTKIVDTIDDHYEDASDNTESGPEALHAMLDTLNGEIPKGVYDALVIMVETITNIIDTDGEVDNGVYLDIKNSNMAMDDKGRIILLDPIVAYDRDNYYTGRRG
jgi:hypothetical protein